MDQPISNQSTESQNPSVDSISSQVVVVEEGSQAEITHMDANLYKNAAEGKIDIHKGQYTEADLQHQRTPKNNNVLHIAAQFDKPDCVKHILKLPLCSSLLQLPNLKGDTPLHLAAREGHSKVVEALIEAAKASSEEIESGVKSDHKKMMRMVNSEKDTALHEAVRYHHTEVVKLLIKEDTEHTYGANITGNTPLYMAAERGFDDLVEIIIHNDRTSTAHSTAHTGVEGRTALHAAVICDHTEMTERILDWRSNLTKEVDHEGWSPLHCATLLGNAKMVTLLLEKSSDRSVIYLQIKNGKKTALHIAAIFGHLDIVQLLIKFSPDCSEQVDDSGKNVFHFSILNPGNNPLELDTNLNMRGLINEKDSEGNTPLHLLATSQLSTRNFISDSKVDKMAFNNKKMTARDILFLREEDLHGEKDKILRELKNAKATAGPLAWKNAIGEGRDRGEEKSISQMKRAGEVHLIVAALIATVTFAAGFTLPGGYNDDDGKAILTKKAALKAFIVTDTIAMVLSLSAVLVYFFLASHEKRDMVSKHLLWGFLLTIIAMGAMVVAFMTGLYAVLPLSSGFPIVTCVIGCFFFTSFYFLFKPILRSKAA